MIKCENLFKSFGPVNAVSGISISISKGEVVGLLGPNGAGKTTTMRLITGYLKATSGRVHIDGIDIDKDGLAARKRIGYLPESAPLYLDLEVTYYLDYIASLHRIPKDARVKRVRKMVDRCALSAVAGRPIGELSKGYRQRVGLAAAMIHEPPILILDEPTSGLDPNQIVEIRDLIREIGRERTVVLSTHIMQEVEATCSRALIISGGSVVGEGTIAELIQRGAAKASYTVSIKDDRKKILAAVEKLPALKFGDFISADNDEKQRFILLGSDGVDRSEEIFDWAVASNFKLQELVRDSASLEEVFRELTHGSH